MEIFFNVYKKDSMILLMNTYGGYFQAPQKFQKLICLIYSLKFLKLQRFMRLSKTRFFKDIWILKGKTHTYFVILGGFISIDV